MALQLAYPQEETWSLKHNVKTIQTRTPLGTRKSAFLFGSQSAKNSMEYQYCLPCRSPGVLLAISKIHVPKRLGNSKPAAHLCDMLHPRHHAGIGVSNDVGVLHRCLHVPKDRGLETIVDTCTKSPTVLVLHPQGIAHPVNDEDHLFLTLLPKKLMVSTMETQSRVALAPQWYPVGSKSCGTEILKSQLLPCWFQIWGLKTCQKKYIRPGLDYRIFVLLLDSEVNRFYMNWHESQTKGSNEFSKYIIPGSAFLRSALAKSDSTGQAMLAPLKPSETSRSSAAA